MHTRSMAQNGCHIEFLCPTPGDGAFWFLTRRWVTNIESVLVLHIVKELETLLLLFALVCL